MHPTLQLQNLSQLGSSHERLATSAANGSLDALRQVVALASTSHLHAGILAPVLFANLDESGIPSRGRWAISAASRDSPVTRAILSLKALSADGALATDAAPDVWPRVWKWVQYLDRYRDHLARLDLFSATALYATYCAIVFRLQEHRETKDLIYATNGVRDVITRAWTIFLDDRTNPDVDFLGVCRFIWDDTVSPINIHGIQMGSGGDITYLARLFAGHLNFVLPDPDSSVSSDTLLLLRGVIRLLHQINHRNELWNSTLLSEGIVEALITATRALAVSSVDGVNPMLDDCFLILIRTLVMPRRHQQIVDALKAGLLHAIVLCPSFNLGVKLFLTALLPRSTVYYSVLKQLNAELDTVQSLVETPRFQASEASESWTAFHELATTRIEIMTRYDNGDWLSGRECDNLECGKRMRTADQQRCSRCGTSYYCSKECQTIDWHDGHRKVCARFQTLLSSDPETLNTRDRSFMWALANYDYLVNKPNLYIQRVSFTNDNPEKKTLVSVLNYTGGEVGVSIRPVSTVHPEIPSFRAIWEENVARAARSKGRMHLVLLLMPEGEDTRYRLLTMRSETSAVQAGIDEIADSLPPGLDLENSVYGPIVAEKMTALLQKDGCNVQLDF